MKVLLSILVLAVTLLGVSAMALALENSANLSLSVGEQYNDNIFLTHSNKLNDYITQISPAVALTSKTEAIDLAVSYRPTLNIYDQHSDINYISHDAGIKGVFKISEKINLEISDSFLQSKDPLFLNQVPAAPSPTPILTPTAPVIAGPTVRGLNRITLNSLDSDLSYRISQRVILDAITEYTIMDNAQQVGDLSTYSGGLGAHYLITDRTTLRADAKYKYFHYRVGSGASVETFTLGAKQRLSTTLTADVYGGLVIASIKQPEHTDYGPVGGVALDNRFEWGTLNISFIRNVIAGYQTNSPLTADIVSMKYTLPIRGALGGSIYGWYGYYKTLSGVQSNTAQKRQDLGGVAEVSYKVLPWADVMLSYSYINGEDKIIKSQSYIDNIVMLTLRVAKQVKF